MSFDSRRLKQQFYTLLALLVAVGVLFYFLQNNGMLPGGQIAVIKLLWLGTVILCWYIIPFFLLIDRQLAPVNGVVGIFLINMIGRAVVELWMMYGLDNWHPYYGIAHDIMTALLCLLLAYRVSTRSRLLTGYLLVMSGLFLVETGFAYYMHMNVKYADGPVYFVPDNEQHSLILTITAIVVLGMFGYLLMFVRKWLYATPPAS